MREVFHLQDVFLGGDVIGGVVRIYRSAELGDDPAAVNLGAYPMDGHSGFRLPCRFHGLVDVVAIHSDAAELREKGGMEVDDPAVIFTNQEVRNDKEETRQNDEVD